LHEQQLPSPQLSFSVLVDALVPQQSLWHPSAQHDFFSQQAESQSPDSQASGLQVHSLQHESGVEAGVVADRL
jgi:hypothetical protein